MKKPLSATQTLLVKKYYPLLLNRIKQLNKSYPSLADELLSVGHDCLVMSALKYNGRSKFSSFFLRKFEFSLKDYFRENYKNGMTMVPRSKRRIDVASIHTLELEPGREGPNYPVESRDLLERLMSGLTKLQKDLCSLVYLQGKTQEEASKTLGVSKSAVSQQILCAIAQMKHKTECLRITS